MSPTERTAWPGHGLIELVSQVLAERADYILAHLNEIPVRVQLAEGVWSDHKLSALPAELAVREAFRLLLRQEEIHFPVGTAVRTLPALADWDRARVRQQIEEASGQPLSVDDSLPDSFIAQAQALGMQPHELQMWIYDGAAADRDWTQAALANFARRYGFARAEETTIGELEREEQLCPGCGLPLAHFAGPEAGERGLICQTPGCDLEERELEDDA
jgi:hypothetical protein